MKAIWPMTATLACTAAPALGFSAESRYVSGRLEELRERLCESRAIGVQATLDDLDALAEECGVRDWNGQDAEPVSDASLAHCRRLIRVLGARASQASLGANSRGWVTMQWGPSAHWTLSLAMTDDGWIHWAAMFGSVREYGTAPFLGSVPKSLADLIQSASIA